MPFNITNLSVFTFAQLSHFARQLIGHERASFTDRTVLEKFVWNNADPRAAAVADLVERGETGPVAGPSTNGKEHAGEPTPSRKRSRVEDEDEDEDIGGGHPNIEARPTKRRRIEPSPFQWRHDRHYTPPVHSARNKDRLRKIRCHNARIDQLERAGGRNKEELKAMKDNLGLMREAIMQKDAEDWRSPMPCPAFNKPDGCPGGCRWANICSYCNDPHHPVQECQQARDHWKLSKPDYMFPCPAFNSSSGCDRQCSRGDFCAACGSPDHWFKDCLNN